MNVGLADAEYAGKRLPSDLPLGRGGRHVERLPYFHFKDLRSTKRPGRRRSTRVSDRLGLSTWRET